MHVYFMNLNFGFSLAELSTGFFRSTMQLHVQIQSGATILLPSASGRRALLHQALVVARCKFSYRCTGKMKKVANDMRRPLMTYHLPFGHLAQGSFQRVELITLRCCFVPKIEFACLFVHST